MNKAMIVGAVLILATGSSALADAAQTETRNVGAFDAIEMRGAAKVDITVGAPQSVKIEAEPKVLSLITTEVRGKTLVVQLKKDWWLDWRQRQVHIAIALPRLAGYSLEGTADTVITGLNGGTTGFSLNGTGSVKASGKLDKLSLNLNGTGSADFSNLPVDTASVSVNGTGSVRVKPKNDLSASVNGVGSIIYEGDPQHLATSINGIGSIKQAQ